LVVFGTGCRSTAINPSKYALSGAFLLFVWFILKTAFSQYAKLNTIQTLPLGFLRSSLTLSSALLMC
jgi:hypothetical protein